ncbi:MAG: hypothetical protein LBR45_05000 [Bacteroidales bacterium]|jgi:hypothetical protein|nr:hypothetical protein [Bacteroidales bacterium]
MLIFFYILNVTLLLLHEIESGYEKEWEILKLPGKLTGFLLLHVPIIFLFFYGFYCIVEYPQTRGILSILAGITGFIPFLIHKVFVNKKGHFDKTVSNIIIYGNMVSATVLVITGIEKVFEV